MGELVTYVETLTCGHDFMAPSLLFSVDRRGQYCRDTKIVQRYLFGTPEELVRFTGCHMIKISAIRAVFICTRDLDHFSGLPEIILSLKQQGVKDVFIVGPHGLSQYLGECGQSIFGNHGTTLQLTDVYGSMRVYDDQFIEVHAVGTDEITYTVSIKLEDQVKKFSVTASANPPVVEGKLFNLKSGPGIDVGRRAQPRGQFKSSERLIRMQALVPDCCASLAPQEQSPETPMLRTYFSPAEMEEPGVAEVLDVEKIQQDVRDDLVEFNLADELKNLPKQESASSTSDMEIVFLGTGCAKPSSKRGQSGIIARFPDGDVLIECGGGTVPMLQRIGEDKVLTDCQFVWISHHHADHMEGLPRFVGYPREKPIVVCGPPAVLRYLKATLAFAGVSPKMTMLNPRQLNQPHPARQLLSWFKSIKSVAVPHARESYGLVLRYGQEQLVFSGDCRPSRELVKAATMDQPAKTLLIHEATFDESMHSDAVTKRHSTVTEALAIASSMRADTVILTHFSQRYPSIQLASQVRVAIAFDGARFNAQSLDIMCNARSATEKFWEMRHARSEARRTITEPRQAAPGMCLPVKRRRNLASDDLTLRLSQFLKKFAPGKVHLAEEMAHSFSGREHDLNDRLRKRYGYALEAVAESAGPVSSDSSDSSSDSPENSVDVDKRPAVVTPKKKNHDNIKLPTEEGSCVTSSESSKPKPIQEAVERNEPTTPKKSPEKQSSPVKASPKKMTPQRMSPQKMTPQKSSVIGQFLKPKSPPKAFDPCDIFREPKPYTVPEEVPTIRSILSITPPWEQERMDPEKPVLEASESSGPAGELIVEQSSTPGRLGLRFDETGACYETCRGAERFEETDETCRFAEHQTKGEKQQSFGIADVSENPVQVEASISSDQKPSGKEPDVSQDLEMQSSREVPESNQEHVDVSRSDHASGPEPEVHSWGKGDANLLKGVIEIEESLDKEKSDLDHTWETAADQSWDKSSSWGKGVAHEKQSWDCGDAWGKEKSYSDHTWAKSESESNWDKAKGKHDESWNREKSWQTCNDEASWEKCEPSWEKPSHVGKGEPSWEKPSYERSWDAGKGGQSWEDDNHKQSWGTGKSEPAYEKGQSKPSWGQGKGESSWEKGPSKPSWGQGKGESFWEKGPSKPSWGPGKGESSWEKGQSKPSWDQGKGESSWQKGHTTTSFGKGKGESVWGKSQSWNAEPSWGEASWGKGDHPSWGHEQSAWSAEPTKGERPCDSSWGPGQICGKAKGSTEWEKIPKQDEHWENEWEEDREGEWREEGPGDWKDDQEGVNADGEEDGNDACDEDSEEEITAKCQESYQQWKMNNMKTLEATNLKAPIKLVDSDDFLSVSSDSDSSDGMVPMVMAGKKVKPKQDAVSALISKAAFSLDRLRNFQTLKVENEPQTHHAAVLSSSDSEDSDSPLMQTEDYSDPAQEVPVDVEIEDAVSAVVEESVDKCVKDSPKRKVSVASADVAPSPIKTIKFVQEAPKSKIFVDSDDSSDASPIQASNVVQPANKIKVLGKVSKKAGIASKPLAVGRFCPQSSEALVTENVSNLLIVPGKVTGSPGRRTRKPMRIMPGTLSGSSPSPDESAPEWNPRATSARKSGSCDASSSDSSDSDGMIPLYSQGKKVASPTSPKLSVLELAAQGLQLARANPPRVPKRIIESDPDTSDSTITGPGKTQKTRRKRKTKKVEPLFYEDTEKQQPSPRKAQIESPEVPPRCRLEKKVRAFYELFNPTRVSDSRAVFNKFGGDVKKLNMLLKARYEYDLDDMSLPSESDRDENI